MSTSEESKRVSMMIPEELFKQIKDAIVGTGFSTVDDYVTYMLYLQVGKKKEEVRAEDDSKVIDQLRSLGYI